MYSGTLRVRESDDCIMDICHRGSSPKYTHEHSHWGLWPYVSHGHLLRPVSLATHLYHRQPWGPAHIGARIPSSVMQTVVSMMMPEGIWQNCFWVKIAIVCNSLLNQTQIWLNNHYPAIGHLYSGIRRTSYPRISCHKCKNNGQLNQWHWWANMNVCWSCEYLAGDRVMQT